MSAHDGGPAFPIILPGITYSDGSAVPSECQDEGMSLRAYYAGQALPAVLAACWNDPKVRQNWADDPFAFLDDCGLMAVKAADAVLRNLEKTKGQS